MVLTRLSDCLQALNMKIIVYGNNDSIRAHLKKCSYV